MEDISDDIQILVYHKATTELEFEIVEVYV